MDYVKIVNMFESLQNLFKDHQVLLPVDPLPFPYKLFQSVSLTILHLYKQINIQK